MFTWFYVFDLFWLHLFNLLYFLRGIENIFIVFVVGRDWVLIFYFFFCLFLIFFIIIFFIHCWFIYYFLWTILFYRLFANLQTLVWWGDSFYFFSFDFFKIVFIQRQTHGADDRFFMLMQLRCVFCLLFRGFSHSELILKNFLLTMNLLVFLNGRRLNL